MSEATEIVVDAQAQSIAEMALVEGAKVELARILFLAEELACAMEANQWECDCGYLCEADPEGGQQPPSATMREFIRRAKES